MKEELIELYKKHTNNLMFYLVIGNPFLCRLLYIENDSNLINDDMLDYLYETVSNDKMNDVTYLEEKVNAIKELPFPDSKTIIEFVEEVNPNNKTSLIRILSLMRKNNNLDLDDLEDISFILYAKKPFFFKEELIASIEDRELCHTLIKYELSDEMLTQKIDKVKFNALYKALSLQGKGKYYVRDYLKTFKLIESKKYMIEQSFSKEKNVCLGEILKYTFFDSMMLNEKIFKLLNKLSSHKKIKKSEYVDRLLGLFYVEEDINEKLDFMIYALNNFSYPSEEDFMDFIVKVFEKGQAKNMYEIISLFGKHIKLSNFALDVILSKLEIIGYKRTLERIQGVLKNIEEENKNPIFKIINSDSYRVSSRVEESLSYLKLVNLD